MWKPVVWGLVTAALAGAEEGRALFEREWTVNDPLSPGGDGLGPLYNATSCVACHRLGGVGGAGDLAANVTLLPRPGVVHNYGTSEGWAAYRERLFTPDQVPHFRCGNAMLAFANRFTQRFRQTPSLFGAAALDQVTVDALERAQFAGEIAGVTGRIAWDDAGRPGRFGWKGQVSTIGEFVEAACANEVGLGTAAMPQPADPTATAAASVGPDLSPAQVADLLAFVGSLPAPRVQVSEDAERGRATFEQVGCTACHAKRIGDVTGAWTDLLLHDLGPRLTAEGSGYTSRTHKEAATADEWRTPPLWGVADTAPYLHDGRAATLDDAIRLHDGEAAPSVVRYTEVGAKERRALLAFLGSLRLGDAAP